MQNQTRILRYLSFLLAIIIVLILGNVSVKAQIPGNFPDDVHSDQNENNSTLYLPNTLYTHSLTNSSSLYVLDLLSGNATTIGVIGQQVTDIAFKGVNLYGVTFSKFLRIDPNSGEVIVIGDLGFDDVNALAVSQNGTIYGATVSGQLITIDDITGQGTLVGLYGTGLSSSGDLAFDQNDTLLASVNRSGFVSDWLVSVDPSSGAATLIGDIGFTNVWGLSFIEDLLYGVTSDGDLLQINPVIGVGTLIGNNGIPLGGLATSSNEAFRIFIPLVSNIPPAPEQIAFVSGRDGNDEIYKMNIDGTGVTNLTNNPYGDHGPSWSSDGNYIVFFSNRFGQQQIFRMNADGSNQIQLLISSAYDEWPYWSPDGSKIAFSRIADHNGDGYRTEVFVMDADGTNVTRLTYSIGYSSSGYANSCWPSGWSPDSMQIIYYCYINDSNQLWKMNLDGSSQTMILNDGNWNAIPTMSPNGTQIAFSSYRDGNYEIYTINADGTNLLRLTIDPNEDWRPIWSPDGKKIIFESKRNGETQIYIMNADGTEQQRVTNTTTYEGQAVWKPE
ncbi:MAG: PD40 domain-containing protein [Anaerolineales bacterium]|nr:PD40 domain-containing protein [Anaerolineales bacterium]